MSASELPAVKVYHPATFLERGVAVPFTTPALGGARVRQADKRLVELVIPNPSGGSGVYIMPGTSITALCRPTLHDKILNERIASLGSITPVTIRQVARAVAAEGLAGEEAMTAGRAALQASKAEKVAANYRMLMLLVAQAAEDLTSAVRADGLAALSAEERARVTVDWVSRRLGRPTVWTAAALEDVADVLAAVGEGGEAGAGRVPQQLAMLRAFRASIGAWSGTMNERVNTPYVRAVCLAADQTISLAGTMLPKAQALYDNIFDLLRSWGADPNTVMEIVARPDWLLDGWEQICLIWKHAKDDARRRGVLSEIVGLIPILPKEVDDWSGQPTHVDTTLRRPATRHEAWRTEAAYFDLVRRNEHFRALACRLR